MMQTQTGTMCVVGAGIIGTWAALHLAEAGVQTTLFEQFPLPHTRGSSHGLSRAFRFLGELELGRLDYSLERWLELEELAGDSLFVKTGLLNFGTPGDADLETFMRVLHEGGRPFEWLDSAAIRKRFPMLNYPREWGAAWDPNGGILVAHRCLAAAQSRFLALGGKIVTGRVKSLEYRSGDSVSINLHSSISGKTDTLTFDSAIVSAGPWTGKLIPGLNKHLHTLLTPVSYWSDPTGCYSAASGFPIIFNARLTGIYGLPSCEYQGLVKMLFHGGPESDPDTRDLASSEPYIEKVTSYVREHLPHLDHAKPAIMETCMYTMSPDGNPIIDRIAGNLVVGCGFSGSGFKHSPATGKMLAALALGQEDTIPTGFRADRYLLKRIQSPDQNQAPEQWQ
jgi:sarcosine oxidase/L-pipecolate oxidase